MHGTHEHVASKPTAIVADHHAPVPLGAAASKRKNTQNGTPAVARLLEVIGAFPMRAFGVREICKIIGTSERTLRTGCKQSFGVGPHGYMLNRRMHLVRDALLRTKPTTTTVTQIAELYGFSELGRFSVRYREIFGESPSATLSA